jgi:signal transduction histidine kinase
MNKTKEELISYHEKQAAQQVKQLKNQIKFQKKQNAELLKLFDLVNHELSAYQWAILGFSTKLQSKYDKLLDEDGKHYLKRININAVKMHTLLESLKNLITIDANSIQKKVFFLNELIIDAINKIKKEIDPNFYCDNKLEKSFLFVGDPAYLQNLFYQIFKNAALYTKNGESGKIYLTCSFKKQLHFYLEDNGIGINEEYRNLVIRPLEQLKEKDVAGIGMGLSFVQRIMHAHRGDIKLETSRYGGLCVHLVFPKDCIKSVSDR